MRFFAILAIAAAVRLQSEVTKDPTAAEVFGECNANGDDVLNFEEVTKCMKKHNIPEKMQKKIGNNLLKFASIDKSRYAAIAKGINELTKLTNVKASDVAACDTNTNGSLSYKEVETCLKAHAKALGLTNKKRWNKAKWALAT